MLIPPDADGGSVVLAADGGARGGIGALPSDRPSAGSGLPSTVVNAGSAGRAGTPAAGSGGNDSPNDACGGCDDGSVCTATGCIERNKIDVVSLGDAHSCRVATGELWCWGANDAMQLGTNDVRARATPERLALRNPSDFLSVALGGHHTCALRAPGVVYCWGDNKQGQLGLGDTNQPNSGMSMGGMPNSGRRPRVALDASDVVAIDCGGDNCCALRTNGALYCWGANGDGSVGVGRDGQAQPRVPTPTQVAQGTRFSAFSVGWGHACAIRADGALVCWGRNDAGQLGTGDSTTQIAPVQVGNQTSWSAIAAGDRHTCGIRGADHQLFCWGSNEELQLGIGSGALDDAPPDTRKPSIVDPHRWSAVAAGGSHTCGIVEDTSELRCWGSGSMGQLGLGDMQSASTPSAVMLPPPRTWRSVALGHQHSCAFDSERKLLCWGANESGQLGVGDMQTRTQPSEVP